MKDTRWLAGGFLFTLFSSYGQTFYIALSSGDIRAEFGLSHGDFGWLYMGATLASAALIPFAGRAIDNFPVHIYGAVVILGLAGSMFLLASSSSILLLFVSLAAIRMFGQGLMPHTAMTAVGRWFVANRGRAVSTVALGHQAGESIAPISFVAIAALVGWRESWALNAAFLALVALPLVWALTRVPRSPQIGETDRRSGARDWTRAEALRDPLFWLLPLGLLLPSAIGTMVFFHQVHLTETKGWGLAYFAGSTPVLSLFAVAATVASGPAIDRIGSPRLIPAMLVFLALANIVLGVIQSVWAIPLYMACMGLSFGLYAPVFGAVWPELYGTRHLGAIKSVATSLMVVGTALTPGLSGWLIDLGIPFPAMIFASGIVAAIAMPIMVLVARRVMARSGGGLAAT